MQLLKSLRFYFLFLRYAAIGLFSFVIDVSVFALLYWMTHYQLYALFIGRVVSGSFNFYFNKYLVYRSMQPAYLKREALYYFILAMVIFILSYSAIMALIHHVHVSIIMAKILVDIVLFVMNFVIQKYLFRTGTLAALKTTSREEILCDV